MAPVGTGSGAVIGESRAMLYTVAKMHYIGDLGQVQIARKLGLSTATISRRAAEATGSIADFIHAPYLPDAAALDFFLADTSVQESVGLWDRIDAAVVGIGQPYGLE